MLSELLPDGDTPPSPHEVALAPPTQYEFAAQATPTEPIQLRWTQEREEESFRLMDKFMDDKEKNSKEEDLHRTEECQSRQVHRCSW